jgi:hypothetical protein
MQDGVVCGRTREGPALEPLPGEIAKKLEDVTDDELKAVIANAARANLG